MFPDLEAGDYKVQVDLAGHPDPLVQKAKLEPGFKLQKDFGLPSGRITGRVIDDDTGKPVAGLKVSLEKYKQEEAEKGEEQSEVRMAIVTTSVSAGAGGGGMQTLSITGGGIPPVETDDEGRYVIRYVKEGEYSVVVSGARYAEARKAPVKVEEGEECGNQNLKVLKGYAISGTLVDAVTGEAISFFPLSCRVAEVEEGEEGSEKGGSAEQDGSFRFTGLRPGKYVLSVNSSISIGGEDGTSSYSGSLEVNLLEEDLEGVLFKVQPQ
jgi:hypothetical protein